MQGCCREQLAVIDGEITARDSTDDDLLRRDFESFAFTPAIQSLDSNRAKSA